MNIVFIFYIFYKFAKFTVNWYYITSNIVLILLCMLFKTWAIVNKIRTMYVSFLFHDKDCFHLWIIAMKGAVE